MTTRRIAGILYMIRSYPLSRIEEVLVGGHVVCVKNSAGQVPGYFHRDRRSNSFANDIASCRTAQVRKSWNRIPRHQLLYTHSPTRKSIIGFPFAHMNTCSSGCFPTPQASTASHTSVRPEVPPPHALQIS